MITIAHLVDDAGLGGVTRNLDTLADRLGSGFIHQRHVVCARASVPPHLDADVIAVHVTMAWSKLPFLAALRMRAGRRPVVLVEHSYTGAYEQLQVGARSRFRAMLRLAYGRVDRVVAVSHGQAAWMRAARLVPVAKLAVIPATTDCARLFDLALPQPSGPLRLGGYGRYCRQKGFDTLIDAMRRIAPDTATLQLAGFGPDTMALRTAAADCPHITVGGPVDDLARFLAGVDAVVIPSRFEAFGQVALEARAAGRPLIASRVDGLVEQVAAGAGLLVAPDDPRALAAAITHLGTMPVEAMGYAARWSATGHLERSVGLWQRLLVELAQPPGTASQARSFALSRAKKSPSAA